MNTIIRGIRGHKRNQLVEFDVDVEIDLRKLAEILGEKALRNKSGKSRAIGSIVVTVRGKPAPVAKPGDAGPALLAAMLPRIGR